MNGGKKVLVYNTGKTNPEEVTSSYQSVSADDYAFDAPCGLPDSAGVGEWRDVAQNFKNEVYLVKTAIGVYKKIVIRSVSEMSYTCPTEILLTEL